MDTPLQALFFRDINNDYVSHIIKEIWHDRVYDPYFQGKKDLTVVDIGANVGLWSYYAAPFAKQIYALEPSSLHFETLTTMLEYNGLTQVKPLKMAVSNFTGMGEFYHNENTTMFSLRPEVNGKPDEKESVQVITLDNLFEKEGLTHVDVLKIDCEGSEAEIFGGEGFDKVKDKIDLVIGEFHTWSGINPEQFKTYFLDRGFSFNWTGQTQAATFVARKES